MKIDDNSMHDLVGAFTRSTKGDLEQNSIENDFVTANGEALYSWNYIFGSISKSAISNGLRYIVVNRNKIWKFVAVLSEDEEELVLFFKEKNLRNITSKFEGRPFHYLSCLLIKNAYLNGQEVSHQSTLFDSFDNDEKKEIDEKRTYEAQKMLKEDFDKIKTIYVCSKEEISGNVVSVTMNLFNERGEVVSRKDITKYMTLDYENTSAMNNANDKTPTIPKLKSEFKDKEKPSIPSEKRREKRENE
ncbi:hypothetical protein EFE32_10100 [Lactococcus lactis subsp. lactis]|uniref:DUF5986 family protein n=1 Tax=Lactococcus lactis TaxID=1358 RepID=UPI00223BDE3F|nr:DUF5986 family protein [Lactococcus lactis]MCT0017167.1 hypothetical protein [Lactococcus lactis subsp. lactis]